MSSGKQASHTCGQQSAEEDNSKKAIRSNMQRSQMRRAASGKESAVSLPKSLEPALPGRWGGRSAEKAPSGSVRKTSKSKQKTPGNGDGGSSSKMPQPPRKKRARAVATVESEEALKKRVDVEVEVKIPEELKPWLVEDWDLVTRQKQLFQLPAKENVDAILEEYANCTKSHGRADNKEYAVAEVVGGIKKYFNVMLGTQLLYEFERPQYAEILLAHPDVPVSHIYGAPHLLRLFVRIGAMLAYKPLGEKRAVLANTPFDEHSLPLLLGYLHDFLKYLAKNSASLFTASDYKVASAEYHLKAL
ncbi:mortality factor 4-like protein 2 [Meriones unguiculatus]|uniref:mortality factor 4-like protein 2 n=1 Tax=Meriones unguiculatus TaxID=10047 RepID=UPI00293F6CBB|nr:mortality factor 4-like protein 2 [Meriones unguiculatus]XP_060230743.1 mortality factor 4-like protein 2 [Meriones unguiculatus]XP_060231357.1 mortality factor 4-like protein 2 [Meriones unguiculatus]XP_060231496.1 mortality factor 4-like protein 2 [Meriones unguiculatus]